MEPRPKFDKPEWAKLLKDAVEVPGRINEAYSMFWNYSIGNQLLALAQCDMRGLKPGPIATYPKWKELKRQVRKGEKALVLCMPISIKAKAEEAGEEPGMRTVFVYKPNWFTLAQTDGEPFVAPPIPEWDRAKALEVLGITEVEFENTNGNIMGYAKRREIAINPVNPMPHKTTFHELGHVLLEHTIETGQTHAGGEVIPRSLREAEAESVAMICSEALGLGGVEFSRDYIQGWLKGSGEIPEKSAAKIFAVADKILKAGRVEAK